MGDGTRSAGRIARITVTAASVAWRPVVPDPDIR
jgi:hypothetical protein